MDNIVSNNVKFIYYSLLYNKFIIKQKNIIFLFDKHRKDLILKSHEYHCKILIDSGGKKIKDPSALTYALNMELYATTSQKHISLHDIHLKMLQKTQITILETKKYYKLLKFDKTFLVNHLLKNHTLSIPKIFLLFLSILLKR